MITQHYNHGENEIKIEMAENLEDAKENKFADGIYSRYYINGKLLNSYMDLIQNIIKESKENRNRLIPKPTEIKKLREDMLLKQKEAIAKQLNDLKETYKQIPNVPQNVLDQIDDYIEKTDLVTGLRIRK